MAAKTFQDIARKYSVTVKLDETASPELWAAKLRDELVAKQRKLQGTNPQNLLHFALEKECLELEEAVQVLNQEVRRSPQPQLLVQVRQAEDELAAKRSKLQETHPQNLLHFVLQKQCVELEAAVQVLHREIRRSGQPQHVEKILQIEDELAAKQSKLQETDPQNLLHFALQKQCLELEAAVQVLNQEVRRIPQQQLLEKMRQAVQNGEKELYDSLIKGETQSLLPTEEEAAYRILLEIKRLAAKKRWPRGATPPPSNPIIADPPQPTTPLPTADFDLPQSDITTQPLPRQAATPSPQAPSEIPEPISVTTAQAPPKRPRVNPWVWVLPTAVMAVVVLYLSFRHSGQPEPVVFNPVSGPTEGSQASPAVPLAGPVTHDGLMLLFDQAHQVTNNADRIRICREFMRQSAEFARAHPEKTDLWMRRAAAAIVLDYSHDGWVAGQELLAANLKHGLDPQVQKVTAALERKGWLEPKIPKRDWSNWTPNRLQAAAVDGDEEAQVALGDCYFGGLLGFAQEYNKSAQWYGEAAQQGNFEAQNKLALLYLNGLGATTNYLVALSWFRKSADQGSAAAPVNLGIMYENGYGVEQNVTEAMNWYRKAVALGNTNAVPYLKRLTQAAQNGAR